MKGAWRIRIKVGDEMVPKNNLEILLNDLNDCSRKRVPKTGETIKVEMMRRISGGFSVQKFGICRSCRGRSK